MLYIRDNKLVVEHNSFGTHRGFESEQPLPAGPAVLRYTFSPAGKTSGQGTLFVNDQQVASKTLELPTTLFYTWEGIDIGRDAGSHVSDAYPAAGDFAFPSGQLSKVELEIKVPSQLALAGGAGTAGK